MLAQKIAEIVKPTWVGLDNDRWGLDHGTWSVLVHAFPEADAPVVQVSINSQKPFAGLDWAQRFDTDARSLMVSAPNHLQRLEGHPDFSLAAPTPDHFLPLAYFAGVASAPGGPADVLVDGYAMGSLSMTSFTVGA